MKHKLCIVIKEKFVSLKYGRGMKKNKNSQIQSLHVLSFVFCFCFSKKTTKKEHIWFGDVLTLDWIQKLPLIKAGIASGLFSMFTGIKTMMADADQNNFVGICFEWFAIFCCHFNWDLNWRSLGLEVKHFVIGHHDPSIYQCNKPNENSVTQSFTEKVVIDLVISLWNTCSLDENK